MSDNRKMLLYFSILFVFVLSTYKMPYDTYSFIQFIIRPIVFENSALHLAGIVPITLIAFAIIGLCKLERFSNHKFLLVLAIFLLIIPVMNSTIDVVRATYHKLNGHELKALDIIDGDIYLSGNNGEVTVTTRLEFIDYGNKVNFFQLRVYLPDSLSQHLGIEYYDFDQTHISRGYRSTSILEEKFTVNIHDATEQTHLFQSRWYWEDFELKLHNEKESIRFLSRAL